MSVPSEFQNGFGLYIVPGVIVVQNDFNIGRDQGLRVLLYDWTRFIVQ